MDILGLGNKANAAIKAATKVAGDWVLETGEIMGGMVYTDLTTLYGSNGIQVEMMGGKVFVTKENNAWYDIEELKAWENDDA